MERTWTSVVEDVDGKLSWCWEVVTRLEDGTQVIAYFYPDRSHAEVVEVTDVVGKVVEGSWDAAVIAARLDEVAVEVTINERAAGAKS